LPGLSVGSGISSAFGQINWFYIDRGPDTLLSQ
jgi:hypothetical protein